MPGVDDCEACQGDLSSLDGITPTTKIQRVLMESPLSKLNPRDAVCVFENTSIGEAVIRMNEIKAGCVLVQDTRGNICGILTERDILFQTTSTIRNLKKIPVCELMTPKVDTLPETSTIACALHYMSVKRYRHIPVIRQNKGPGVLSSRDILKYLTDHLQKV